MATLGRIRAGAEDVAEAMVRSVWCVKEKGLDLYVF